MKGIYLGSLALALLGMVQAEDPVDAQILTTYEVQVVTSQLLITTRVPVFITLTDSAGSATATIATDVSSAGPTTVVSSSLVPVGTGTTSVPLTTSTLTSTILETITSCISNPSCTNGHIVTRTTVFTTVCPVTQVGDSTVVVSSTRTLTTPTSIAAGVFPPGSLNYTGTGTVFHPTGGATGHTRPTALPSSFNTSSRAAPFTTKHAAPSTTESPTRTITVPCETTYIDGGLVPFQGVPVQAGARVTMDGTIYSFPASASGSINLAHTRPSGHPLPVVNGTRPHRGPVDPTHVLPKRPTGFPSRVNAGRHRRGQ